MDDCTATGTTQLDGQTYATICNLPAGHPGDQHEDTVLGEWVQGLTSMDLRGS
ncbi:hypothetical protein F4556_005202 [Kitasatospora gansuensis]|uniref:Uncharacterized protein n=1 Tax=Kitasatospora gansuensis TaxID=258050 RepID=A0A7W7SFY7_9ACTN|nr:hypothetical protein [Kitasatospora gansuensis]MBB4949667.1 hypothetical protein [Kitasatospora gansuensis]